MGKKEKRMNEGRRVSGGGGQGRGKEGRGVEMPCHPPVFVC